MPPVELVQKVGHLLRGLSSSEPDGASTSDLARAASLSRSTTHRLLHALLEEGLVERDTVTGQWTLGLETYLLGNLSSARYDVTARAQPFVRQLSTETGESAFFSVLRGDETVCLVSEDGSFPLRSHVLHEGVRFPLGVASAGLAILAFLPDSEIAQYLARSDLAALYGPSHARAEIEGRISDTRRSGFAVNPGLVVEGSWGMGTAVFNSDGRPVGALTLTGVEHRFRAPRRQAMGRLLMDVSHRLSQQVA